jgi:hypothetical protein
VRSGALFNPAFHRSLPAIVVASSPAVRRAGQGVPAADGRTCGRVCRESSRLGQCQRVSGSAVGCIVVGVIVGISLACRASLPIGAGELDGNCSRPVLQDARRRGGSARRSAKCRTHTRVGVDHFAAIVAPTGATILMPFCPLRTTRPAFSHAWKPRTSVACGHWARIRS